MTSYPSYPELSQGTTPELSQPSLIGEGSSGVHPTAELSQGQPESTATKPKRIQRHRTKGWRKPDGAISVARPHKWGNPFEVGRDAVDAAEAVWQYRPSQRDSGISWKDVTSAISARRVSCRGAEG